MNIQYQTALKNNPTISSKHSEYVHTLTSLSLDEIINLEAIYNSGNQFPSSLRELLFLAGQECYVLDYAMNDCQEEMQDSSRNWLTRFGLSITRPFFVIDVHRTGDTFLFVYLDENINDPMVYEATLDNSQFQDGSWLKNLEASLSSFVNSRIGYLQRGLNPH